MDEFLARIRQHTAKVILACSPGGGHPRRRALRAPVKGKRSGPLPLVAGGESFKRARFGLCHPAQNQRYTR